MMRAKSSKAGKTSVKGRILSVRGSGVLYRLSDFVSGIRRNNRHDEFVWGKPVGREN
jgi:hypothetical protein